jgi:hypothetical protein
MFWVELRYISFGFWVFIALSRISAKDLYKGLYINIIKEYPSYRSLTFNPLNPPNRQHSQT